MTNLLCGAAMDGGTGLTNKGRQFVMRAQELGIMLDMSHISERGFWDTLEISTRPVIAGHSNSKAVCNVPRNLSDEQFAALVRRGGGSGINLYPEFLGLGRELLTLFLRISITLCPSAAKRSVFLGCDLDGIEETPHGISGVQDLGKYTKRCSGTIIPSSLFVIFSGIIFLKLWRRRCEYSNLRQKQML